jgi:cell division protease FtsH
MGMSDVVGPRNVSDSQLSPMQRAMGASGGDGPILQNKIDDEIDRILTEQYERGMKIMTENRPILDQIAKTLIEKEKMNGLELLKIIQDIKPELIPAGSAAKLKEFVGRVGTN